MKAVAAAVVALAPAAYAQLHVVERYSSVSAWEHLIDLGGNDLGVVSADVTRTDLLPFDHAVSAGGYTAIQQSAFGPGAATFVCTAFGTPQSMGWGAGESAFVLTFDLRDAAAYSLEGDFARFIGDSRIVLYAEADILLRHDAPAFPAEHFRYDGVLGPGRYRLEIVAQSDFGSIAGAFTVVPAPAPALALLGVLAFRRRR